MKPIAGIIYKRLLAVIVFVGCSAVVCCGVNKHPLNVKCGYQKEGSAIEESVENMQPSQLVSIRIMDLL